MLLLAIISVTAFLLCSFNKLFHSIRALSFFLLISCFVNMKFVLSCKKLEIQHFSSVHQENYIFFLYRTTSLVQVGVGCISCPVPVY